MSKSHFGLIGLGVMGENLVLNAERNGFSSVVYNRTYAKTEDFLQGRGKDKNIQGATDLEDFVGKLERPRRILMMVKACLLYTSPSPRDRTRSRMPSSA